MPRAIWSGSISFGLVNIPVKLYSAVSPQDRALQPARRAHRRAHQAEAGVGRDGEEVPVRRRSSRATSSPSGAYVIVTDDELAALDPKAVRTIDIEEFVDLSTSTRSSTTAPTTSRPTRRAKPYALLAEAMEEAGKVGIAHFVMRTKQYLAAIRPRTAAAALDDGLRRRDQRPGRDRRARRPRRRRDRRQGAGHGRRSSSSRWPPTSSPTSSRTPTARRCSS